jgi:hypothetical protein
MLCDQPLPDGVYRWYNFVLNGERFVYTLGGRFEIEGECVVLLADPTGLLARHLAPGPITRAKRLFLSSLLSGSYRYVIRELPGVAYLPTFAHGSE